MAINVDLAGWILERIDDVVMLQDMDGRLVYVSPSVGRLTGRTTEELVGTCGADLAHPDDRCYLATSAAGEGTVSEVEFRCRTRDGSVRWVAARSRTLCDEAGRPFRVLHRLRDITESREGEEDGKLEALGRVAGGVAHEFNNLLTVLTGYTSLLLDAHGPDDPDHEPLMQMRGAADRAAGLVRQLLAVAGRQMLTPTRIDLNAVILRLTEVLKCLLGPAVHLRLSLDPALHAIRMDRDQLEQVLLDLAANAHDAMPSGGEFTLTTANVAEDAPLVSRPVVRLTVADTGRGMDEPVLARLFEPFFSTKEVGQSSGLRLAAIRGVMRQSGGYISAASRPGQGTVFTLTFTVAPEVQ